MPSRGDEGSESDQEVLADVAADRGADTLEGLGQGASQEVVGSGDTERKHAKNQGILNQVLTLRLAQQLVDLYIQLQKQGIHVLSSPQVLRSCQSLSSHKTAIQVPKYLSKLSISPSISCAIYDYSGGE
jgi:hypothetical protein